MSILEGTGSPGVGHVCDPFPSQRSPGAWTRPRERKFPEGVRGARADGHGRFPKWAAEVL